MRAGLSADDKDKDGKISCDEYVDAVTKAVKVSAIYTGVQHLSLPLSRRSPPVGLTSSD